MINAATTGSSRPDKCDKGSAISPGEPFPSNSWPNYWVNVAVVFQFGGQFEQSLGA